MAKLVSKKTVETKVYIVNKEKNVKIRLENCKMITT